MRWFVRGDAISRVKDLGPAISAAVVGGVCCGLLLAWASKPVRSTSGNTAVRYVEFPPLESAAPVTAKPAQDQTLIVVPATGGEAKEVEAVKVRNRRLEALVKVLQQRDAEARRQQAQHE